MGTEGLTKKLNPVKILEVQALWGVVYIGGGCGVLVGGGGCGLLGRGSKLLVNIKKKR